MPHIKKFSVHAEHKDFHTLVQNLLPLASMALEQCGEFCPFGGALQKNGKLQTVEPEENDLYTAETPDLIHWVSERLSQGARRGRFRATARLVHVSVNSPMTNSQRDAIQLRLDHHSGVSIELYFPYRMKRPGVLTLGHAFSQPGEGSIFNGTYRSQRKHR